MKTIASTILITFTILVNTPFEKIRPFDVKINKKITIDSLKVSNYIYEDDSLKVEVNIKVISVDTISFKIISSNKIQGGGIPIIIGTAIKDNDSPIWHKDKDLNNYYAWTRYRYSSKEGCNGVILINCSQEPEYKINKEDRLYLANDCIKLTKHTLKKVRCRI